MSQTPLDPAEAVARLARIDFARSDLTQTLGTIAGLARDSVAAPDDVSVTLMTEGTGTTAAFTGDLAMALDEQQYDRGYGPCLDACVAGETLSVDDAATEQRWPAFTRRALELGVHSSLSVPLPIQHSVTGALNLYSLPRMPSTPPPRAPPPSSPATRRSPSRTRILRSATTLIERMRHAARTRAIIDQAKGILMGRHTMTAEAARPRRPHPRRATVGPPAQRRRPRPRRRQRRRRPRARRRGPAGARRDDQIVRKVRRRVTTVPEPSDWPRRARARPATLTRPSPSQQDHARRAAADRHA